MKTALLFCTAVVCSGLLFAQEFNKIRKLVDRGFYQSALEEIEKELPDDPDNDKLNFYAGLSRLRLYQQDRALEHLRKSDPVVDGRYFYYLSLALLETDQIEEAMEAWEQQDKSLLSSEEIEVHSTYLQSFNILKDAPKGVVVKNLGKVINSDGHEYSGVMTQDQKSVVYTVRKEGVDVLAGDGMAYEQIFQTSLDSLGHWNPPSQFGNHSSRRQHDATVQFFGRDTKMVTYHNGDLYISFFQDGDWSDTEPLDMINSEEGDETHCFINDAFDTIYYTTTLNSQRGDLDLYMITKGNDGNWSDPRPLDELNTKFNDDAPFLGGNGELYFSSKGHNSIGGYDIFKTRMDKATGKWSRPENMGYPINSPSDDIYYNTFGKIAYLSSGRKEGSGNMDIYRVFLFDKIRIVGQVVDDKTQKVLAGARISVREFDDLYETYSDSLGRYEILVPIEQAFDMNITYQNQLIYSEKQQVKIFFKDYNDNVVHFKVNLENQDFSDDIPEAEVEGFVSNVREISVNMVNDYSVDPLKVTPDEVAKSDVVTLEVLHPKVRQEEKRELPDPPLIYFDFNSYQLGLEAKKKLTEFVGQLNGPVSVQLTGHSDIVGSKAYNDRLSEARVRVVNEYMISEGLSSNQIRISFRGERNPVTTSPDKQHLNRRVEVMLGEGS